MRRRIRHSVLALLALAALIAPAGGNADGVAAVTAGGAPARARAATERCEFGDALPGQAALEDVQDATLCLMNAQRTARGLGRLRAQPLLAQAAARHARQMVRQRFFDHTSPGGSTMLSRIKSTTYLRDVVAWTVGENLAWGTGRRSSPRSILAGWMNSPGHRANILNGSFHEIGIGVAYGAPIRGGRRGATYATDFGARG
jgi:uncharacterized protein YkwD